MLCYDKLWKGWGFRVGTWNTDSLTGRAGELVEVLAERKMDVACVQETQRRSSGRRFFVAIRAKGISCFGWEVRQRLMA